MRILLNIVRTTTRNFPSSNIYFHNHNRPQKFVFPQLGHLSKYFSSAVSPEVNYEEVKSATKDQTKFVIDVREPEELQQTGIIPESVNIPLGSVEDVLKNMSAEDFRKKYGKNKPSPDSPLIFSCKLGKRSAQAQEIARRLGYQNVYNYLGGWLDWENREKNN